MPVLELPNGEYAMVDDGASPQAIARIMAANRTKKKAPATKPLTGEAAEVQKRVNQVHAMQNSNPLSRVSGATGGYTDRAMEGLLSSFGGEFSGLLSGGTKGVYNAVKNRDLHEIGKEYRVSRDTHDKLLQDSEGAGGTAAEIAGALVNPLGTGTKVLGLAGEGSRLAKLGLKLDKAPALVQAAVAGGNQGAINALGSADSTDDVLGTIANGYGAGAIGGLAFGGLVHGGRRIKQIFADRGADAAERTAYSRIAAMLEGNKVTPERAARELAVTNARGGDGMVMDLSPGLRAQAGAIARKPNIPSSNELISRGDARIANRPELFENEIRRAIAPKTGQDADARMGSVRGAQRAAGKADYEAVLDKPFVWNDQLQDFVHNAPPITRAAMRDAVKLVENERIDPTSIGFKFVGDGDVGFEKVPSMRVFDYMKRSFDQHIGTALRAGDRNTARVLSGELDTLKAGIAKSNPEYQDVLDKQRDYFQKTTAVETGLDVIKRMRREPKKVLKELRALEPQHQDDARTGIVDAIVGLRSSNADPVKFMRTVMRSPEQRSVLEFAFNGRGNLSRFERWMNRELRATRADVLTAPGRQSETNRFDQADESLKGNMGGLMQDALRGFAFGGPAGATAAGVRKFHDLRTGTGEAAMDEIAKILMSNGADLPKGVSAAKQYQARRKAANTKAAIAAGKAGQQVFTSGYGG